MHGSRGYLGCCTRPPLVISVDEPSKGLKIKGQRVKKLSLTEDFWSTSSGGMDNSAFPSQRSISSISTSNQTLDTHCGAGSTSNPADFVNHGKNYYEGGNCGALYAEVEMNSPTPFHYLTTLRGLLLWNQTRQQWIRNKASQKRVKAEEPKLSWNTTYESLLGTSKPFPQPIPLPEMVDFLVDVWEQDGLYD